MVACHFPYAALQGSREACLLENKYGRRLYRMKVDIARGCPPRSARELAMVCSWLRDDRLLERTQHARKVLISTWSTTRIKRHGHVGVGQPCLVVRAVNDIPAVSGLAAPERGGLSIKALTPSTHAVSRGQGSPRPDSVMGECRDDNDWVVDGRSGASSSCVETNRVLRTRLTICRWRKM